MENPYAPPQTAGMVPMPGAGGIALSGTSVRFSGAATKNDVVKALGQSTGTLFFWFSVVFLPIFFGYAIASGGGDLRSALVMMGVGVAVGFLWYRQSGWGRASRYLKGSPRTLDHQSGEITADAIRIHSIHGWMECGWDAIAGIDLQHDRITLAANPQHLAFIFLPRHLFDEANWSRLFQALTLLAPALPFRPNHLILADSQRLANGPLRDLGKVPPDSIMLDGKLTSAELLQSPYGIRLFRKWLITMIITFGFLMVFLWGMGAFELLGNYLWFVAIVPAIWLYRIYKWLASARGHEQKTLVKIKAAVSESMLKIVTPRGISGVYWSAMNDALIGTNIICLRENRHSPNVIPLPRSALVDSQQWDQLVELVKRKVDDDEMVDAIDATLVDAGLDLGLARK